MALIERKEVIVPRMKPVAPDSWEVRDRLLNSQEESQRVFIEFPGPSIVVGIQPVVRMDAPLGGLIEPTDEDVLALIDLDNQRRFTSANGMATAAGRGAAFVTMSALSTRYRDLYWELDSPRPVLGVTFRWRVTTPAQFQHAMCSIAFFVLTSRS